MGTAHLLRKVKDGFLLLLARLGCEGVFEWRPGSCLISCMEAQERNALRSAASLLPPASSTKREDLWQGLLACCRNSRLKDLQWLCEGRGILCHPCQVDGGFKTPWQCSVREAHSKL